ncbi:MAG: hypothetical protein EOO24_04585 [Comamonadaceae bacterium]|nr:MAG: hypothetical protein EOO24_04585 [Comamonadaceae bacterium]
MNIACLAWGSLLWKTGPLLLASPWRPDGPRLPIEFCRVGDSGELSTALSDSAELQGTWWALLDAQDIDTAREQLREREQIDPSRPDWVGTLPGRSDGPQAVRIAQWMSGRPVDAVVWTALPPRIDGVEGRHPDAREAVAYLRSLGGETRGHAEDYVRRTPASLATATRRAIENGLGWTPYAAPGGPSLPGSPEA